MKIYALNGMQSHCESVKKNVALVGSIVLRGFKNENDIYLLEGSHRMAYAVDLGLPITIVLFGKDEIIPHDCYDEENPEVLPRDYVAAGELALILIKERELWNQAVYESANHPNINIVKPVNETGESVHSRLICYSPFSAFPQKIWEVMFGEVKDVVGKHVLIFGKKKLAEAFKTLGADVIFIDTDIHKHINTSKLNHKQFDLIYAADIQRQTNMGELFSMYKELLKDSGLAVTLNDEQTPELISAARLHIYWFTEAHERYPKVSFVRKTGA